MLYKSKQLNILISAIISHINYYTLYYQFRMSTPFQQMHEQLQVEPSPYQSRKQKNYGCHILLMKNSQGQPRFMLGPHSYVFLGTFAVSIAVMVYILRSVMNIIPLPLFILECMTSAAFAISYLNIGFSLPGIASSQQQLPIEQRNPERYCHKCKINRQKKTTHCENCDVCILEHDHHCPWIGKCVGKNNLFSFYLFLGCTFGNLIILLVGTLTGKK